MVACGCVGQPSWRLQRGGVAAPDAVQSYRRVYSHQQYIGNTKGASGVPSQQRVSYAVDMTTKGTPGRMVRIDDDTWAAYGELCKAEGTSRADDIRRHVHARVAAWRKTQRAESKS